MDERRAPQSDAQRMSPVRRPFTRRTFLTFSAYGFGAALLAACAPSAPAPSTDTSAAPAAAEVVSDASWEDGMLHAGGNPKRGGTLRTAFGVNTQHFDMHQGIGAGAGPLTQTYNNLVRNNPLDGLYSVVGDLAHSYEVSEDGMLYTFHLREGVSFHDGTPFTAEDVVATFNRIINPPEGILAVDRAQFSAVTEVEQVDDFTVAFHLAAPQAYFLSLLTQTSMIIYSKKHLEENNYDLRSVVTPGTGPFKFVDFQPQQRWILERNPDYWNPELPYLDGLEMIDVSAVADRGTAVLTGQADVSFHVSVDTWEEGRNRTDLVGTNQVPAFGSFNLMMNNNHEILKDVRVRRAIRLAVLKQAVIAAFGAIVKINVTRWVAHGDPFAQDQEQILQLPGYREDKSEDIAAAQALMAEAGYPDGFSGVDIIVASRADHADVLAPAIQDQLKRTLNIDATLRVMDRSLLKPEQQQGNFVFAMDTADNALSDFAVHAKLWWHSEGSQNFSGYSNPDLDALIDQIDVETDDAVRADLILQALDVLDDDPPWCTIGHAFHLPMWQRKVNGLPLERRRFSETGRLETAWLDV